MSTVTKAVSTGLTSAGTLAPHALRGLQNIVGERNASADRAILSTYYWNGGVGAMPGPKQGKNWPIAVVMPGSTEEVAAVVKLCVAEGLQYRAHSTGNGATYLAQSPNVVVVDLVRMNRIVKIDRVNQMAVIEPYATAGKLQAEAMKQGMTCHIVGAGPSHSPLASATSFLGIGVTGASTGHNARNMLALEWVSPSGEIVRIGTGGERWFSEEGPGPGFRGILRGLIGANGSLGIFTRIGYKLYPWAGPTQPQVTGRFPMQGMAVPDNMRLFFPVWPTPEQMTEATFRINRSGVAFCVLRMAPGHTGWLLTPSNLDYVRRRRAGSLPEFLDKDNRFAWQILTIGTSPRHSALQEATVRRIVEETGGRMMAVDAYYEQLLVRCMVTSAAVPRGSRGALSGATSWGVCDSFALWPHALRAAESMMREQSKPGGAYASDNHEGFWAWPTESRQLWCENVLTGGGGRPKSVAVALRGFLEHFYRGERDPRYGILAFAAGPLFDLYGARMSRVNTWMRRIKHRLDPGGHADHTMSVAPAEPAMARWWPLIQRLLFSPMGRPILKAATEKMTAEAPKRDARGAQ